MYLGLDTAGDQEPDSSLFLWWEIAGAAHADTYLLGAAFYDSGDLPSAELAQLMAATAEPLGIPCRVPVNSGPQHHYVAQAGSHCSQPYQP